MISEGMAGSTFTRVTKDGDVVSELESGKIPQSY